MKSYTELLVEQEPKQESKREVSTDVFVKIKKYSKIFNHLEDKMVLWRLPVSEARKLEDLIDSVAPLMKPIEEFMEKS